ncbi:hypothetical protein [Lacinutrix himadriensis]|uniref:hypothetical protein n=1 Tax=Lacinutrix himadriensis TaxID=641549 RepID=UPI0009F9706B|nr:hypothetical protein [Lacinutrix himadriensis]
MELKETDIEDIEDLILKIENTFQIQFEQNEFENVRTYGDLCDKITKKIELQSVDDCTSQQAFYRLRNAINKFTESEKNEVIPKTKLIDLFPKKNRISKIREIEKELGFELSILSPTKFVNGIISLLMLVSFIGIFFSWKLGFLGIGISTFGFWIAQKSGNTFTIKTVGNLTDKIVRDNYLKSRRNSKTVNRKEIENVISDLFSDYLYLDKSKLTREAELY